MVILAILKYFHQINFRNCMVLHIKIEYYLNKFFLVIL